MPAKPSLGLYFNDNSVELSQISNDGMRLERFNQLILPAGVVVNNEIKEAVVFSQILHQLFSTAKPHPIPINNEVVIGISDNRVFLNEFTVPNVPGKKIEDAIAFQVRSLLPVLPSGMETDWEIIGKSAEGSIEVLVAAIPSSIINSCVTVCTGVGLRVVAIEPAIFANIRIIKQIQLQDKNQLLIYLGDNFGVFSYVTSGHPRFSDFLPQSEIEKKGELAQTVLEYINFANSKHPNRAVTEVIISGSRQEIEKTVEYLKLEKINASLALSRLFMTEVDNHTLLHTSSGLGLKTFDPQPSLNLLPMDFRLGVIKARMIQTWKLVMNILMVFSLLGLLGLYYLNFQAVRKQTDLKTQKERYEQQLNLVENQNLIKQADKLNKITSELMTLRSVTGGEEKILRELSAITPTGITLTSLVISRNPTPKKLAEAGSSWVITGTAVSRPVALTFYQNLLATPVFAGGKLYFGSLEKEVGLTFRIANITTK